jgi:hypothetical protein
MRYCPRCDNTRWICEKHADLPFIGERACGCGSAGAPCLPVTGPIFQTPNDVPAMPAALKPDLS